MTDAPPVVTVWRDLGTEWGQVGQIGTSSTLTWTPSLNDVGSWATTLPYEEQAELLEEDRLVLIDFRDTSTTWGIGTLTPSSDEETGEPTLTAAGVSALSMLGWENAWPDPTKAITAQPVLSETDPAPYKGPAETVITQIVAGNFRDRAGFNIVVPTSQGRGSTQSARPVFDNMLELVTNVAKLGGLCVDLGLVRTTPMRAQLTLRIWEPVDRTRSVQLTAAAGTLTSWEQVDTEPTATRAIVGGAGNGGADRVFQVVTTPASEAAAARWGGHRTIFVDGPSSFDPEELTQAGQQALTEGAETRTLSFTSAESEGMMAFFHYDVGDKATAEVMTGASVNDVITSISVTLDENGLTIGPVFGNPSATDAEMDLAEQIGQLKRAVRQQQTKSTAHVPTTAHP